MVPLGFPAALFIEKSEKIMKIGLVLEGGANRGVFTAGAIDFLLEQGKNVLVEVEVIALA